jgi:hypothetical protein
LTLWPAAILRKSPQILLASEAHISLSTDTTEQFPLELPSFGHRRMNNPLRDLGENARRSFLDPHSF